VSEAQTEPVVDLLEEQWTAIAELGDTFEPAEWALPSECPGWSVKDVLSHMVGTELSLLGEPSPDPVRDAAHIHNEVGARNEGWVLSLHDSSGAEVLKRFRDATERRLAELRSWPTSRFDQEGPSPVGTVPYREFMRVRVMDCWVHEQDMRVATARPGHRQGPAATLAVNRLASAMPFIVGKKVGAADGTAVRFEVRGDDPRRLDVVVRDGRAALDNDALGQGDPTVRLRMDLEVFWRLGCGRVTGPAARAAGLVDIDGDVDLGASVVDAMAFMI